MKKIIIAACAVLMTVGFTACDDESAEAFRKGWNSTAPAEYHYAPNAADAESDTPATQPEAVEKAE